MVCLGTRICFWLFGFAGMDIEISGLGFWGSRDLGFERLKLNVLGIQGFGPEI